MTTSPKGPRCAPLPAPAEMRRCKLSTQDDATTKHDKPYAWLLLQAMRPHVADVLSSLAGRLHDDDAYQPFAILAREGIDAQLAYVQHVVMTPAMPAEPLIDLEDVQAVLDVLACVVGFDAESGHALNLACEKLVDLLKRGVKS